MDVSLQLLCHIIVPASLGQAVLMMAAGTQCPWHLASCPMDTADLVEMICKCMAFLMGCISPLKQVHWETSVPFGVALSSYQAVIVLYL